MHSLQQSAVRYKTAVNCPHLPCCNSINQSKCELHFCILLLPECVLWCKSHRTFYMAGEVESFLFKNVGPLIIIISFTFKSMYHKSSCLCFFKVLQIMILAVEKFQQQSILSCQQVINWPIFIFNSKIFRFYFFKCSCSGCSQVTGLP